MKYKAIPIRSYTHIYLDNVKCTDRQIKKKNKFITEAEAQEWIDLNEESKQNIKTIVYDLDKLKL